MSLSSVSVVIPTLNRPTLVARALNSVIAQTAPPSEIIVVVDGPNEQTFEVLRSSSYSAVRVLQLPRQSGASAARNFGVQNARGDWIAFLDDDDEWLPHKLQRQLLAAAVSRRQYPIVFSRVIARTPRGDFLMPHRGPRFSESVDEYLYCRRTLRSGEVFLHTSNLLAPRQLFNRVPFTPGLRKWQDVDWLLRAGRVSGATLEFVPEPLSIYHCEDFSRPTVSDACDWRYLFEWASSNHRIFSRSAYSGVMLISIMREAVRERDRRAILPLARQACKGSPRPIQLLWFLAGLIAFLLPTSACHRLRLGLRNPYVLPDRMALHSTQPF
jgi:glycosyltransferase involved in cell wall biosynthesis